MCPKEELTAAYSFFASYVAQMHSWCGDGPAWSWPQNYPAEARVVIQATAQTKKEAVELAQRLRALTV